MQQAVQAVRDVNVPIDEINTATGEQSAGIAEIKQALDHIEALTQQDSALVSHFSISANTLGRNAQTVIETVSAFRI
ncbi:hypothetical protein M3I54_24690 [Paraburkholderia sp. CNPSo 3274]|nr:MULTISPECIES: hypothetical protein [unclassified Paraburkholderia]MCP3710125.1 hypothetical protein [Paraburkholderia sp. CNPSo 3274]MCX5543370.1 hypothetical protein [Paraburkholderia sp. CNPSo 3076]